MSDEYNTLNLDVENSSIDVKAEQPEKFPFDAWTFDNPNTNSNPELVLDSSWKLNISDLVGSWEQGAAESGYLRLGDVQICYGQFTSTSSGDMAETSFPAEFANATYSLVLTPETADPVTNPRASTIASRAVDGFVAQTWTGGAGGRSTVGGSYIAIGLWR